MWRIPPPSIALNGPILRRVKVLYSLKQASLTHFEQLAEALAEMSFISQPFDACVFLSTDHNIIVVVYVDDLTAARSCTDINRLIDHLRSRFMLIVKSSLKYIL